MTKYTSLGVGPNRTDMFMIKDWQPHCILYTAAVTPFQHYRNKNVHTVDGFGEITFLQISSNISKQVALVNSYFMHLHALKNGEEKSFVG